MASDAPYSTVSGIDAASTSYPGPHYLRFRGTRGESSTGDRPVSNPIRLFVGADGTNADLESQAVLEYSVRKHASQPVEITWMQQAAKGPYAGWQTASARTPFSHFRWSLPSACGYQGKAIYCDSDFIFLADIAELWAQDVPRVINMKTTDGKLKTCCMVFDCAKAKGHIPSVDELRRMPNANDAMLVFVREHRELLSTFDGDWNCIDGGSYERLDDPRIKAIHYSRIETQPQLRHAIPRLQAEGREHWYKGEVRRHWRQDLLDLFDGLLAEATAAGYGIERYRVTPFAGATRRDFRYSGHKGGTA